MTTIEAQRSLVLLSYGTLATLTGIKTFDELDDMLSEKLEAIENTDVTDCSRWQDVWNKLNSNHAERSEQRRNHE
jgi:hypothetical protein